MKRRLLYLLPLLLLLSTQSPMLYAQAPQTMSYQGRLTDGSDISVANGNRTFTFKLYNTASGGTALWEETQNAAVSNGVFSVLLGDVTPLDLPFDEPYWLGVTVDGGTEMLPRSALASSPYSLFSANGAGADFSRFDLLQGLTTTVTNLARLQITAPTDGYALLVLSGDVIFFGENTTASVGIGTSTTVLDIISATGGILDGSGTQRFYESISANIVVPVTKGDNTFYVNAQKSTVFDTAGVNVANVVASAVFVAKKY